MSLITPDKQIAGAGAAQAPRETSPETKSSPGASLPGLNREQLQTIVAGALDAIWGWDPGGHIIHWNDQAAKLLGYAPSDVIGRSLLMLVPPELHNAARDAIAGINHGQAFHQMETRRLHKDGSPIEVELTIVPMIGPDGKIVGAWTVCRDLRERRRVEAALAKRMDELTTLAHLSERLQLARDLPEVYEASLAAILAALDCQRASILLFDQHGVMRFVASRGLSEEYRRAVDGHSPWSPGTTNATPLCVEDILRSDEPDALKQTVVREGIRGLAFIPLISDGRLIGKFMSYYEQPHVFGEHEISLTNTIARQLALAIARKQAEHELRESEARFRLMSEHAPIMIWMSDAQGRCLHLNGMLRRFWNVADDAVASFDWGDMMHPDDAPHIAGQMAHALASRQPVSIKGRYRDATSSYRVLQTDARPRFSSAGEFLGMIGVNADITERERSEHALRESEERFRLAVEASPSGMVMMDTDGRIVLLNAQAEQLFGYAREELIGRSIETLVPDRFETAHPSFRRSYLRQPTCRPMGEGRELFARRKDGSEVAVEIGLSPLETPRGAMVLAAVVDITTRKRAEQHRELLVAELNHRVKNTLAVVQGIAHQTFRSEQAPPELRRRFEGRLLALAQAHNLLTAANWENASLEHLAALTLEVPGENASRVSLHGPSTKLAPKQALSLSLALHELCTNAKKHGALSNDTGRVTVEWAVRNGDPRQLTLQWREQGGPPVAQPTRQGFGMVLLKRTLAQDMQGEVSLAFDPDGLKFALVAQLQ